MKKIRIGSGAGTATDRLDPALDLIVNGNLDYIGFECLAERTIAFAQSRKRKDPGKGYNELLEYRFERMLRPSIENGVKIITNMGAANPKSAAEVVAQIAKDQGFSGIKIAYVEGDDVFSRIASYYDLKTMEYGQPLELLHNNLVSANAYIGAAGVVEALRGGATIVITGRVADPSLFIAPLVYEFGWDMADYNLMGKGTLIGHLLECAGQSCGGYFADPTYKDVPEPWRLGFPLAEVDENGNAVITKTATSGGCVSLQTIKEQTLYEILDPEKYFTPDCVADFSKVRVEQVGKDMVKVEGASGKPPTGLYKCSCGYCDGYIGEGEISYGGIGALERAKLAAEIIEKRLRLKNIHCQEFHKSFIGYNSLFGDTMTEASAGEQPGEVRLRVAGRTSTYQEASEVAYEVEGLWCNGPAGGGGVRHNIREVLSIASVLMPASDVTLSVSYLEV